MSSSSSRITILFLAADPSDAVRLRLGQELRDIREKLQLSKYRDRFTLESRESVRPRDITQAIFDVEPQIVHFSGHGMDTGELYFEDVFGKIQPVQPDALATLFELVADQVNCVILNACYSEMQAKAIAEHISFVIGMNHAIGDQSAINFSAGFYRALGANHAIEKAYKFGLAELRLERRLPDLETPVLYTKRQQPQEIKIRWTLTLNATLDNLDDQQLENIMSSLRLISGDASLTLQKVEAGSVKLFLEGSSKGLEQLETLLKTGQLEEILGISIQGVQAENINDEVIHTSSLVGSNNQRIPRRSRSGTRSLQILGLFLTTISIYLFLNWFNNVLLPLSLLKSLPVTRAVPAIHEIRLGNVLMECHVSQNWTTSSPKLLLNCDGSEVRVQQAPRNIKNLSSKIVAPGQKRAIAISDPVVIIGKMAPGKSSNLVEADLLAYGNRSSNLSALQASGVLQIVSAEMTGLLGLLLLFIDWRLSRARRARRISEAWQAEKVHASSHRKNDSHSTL
jgi:hypothetical protein